MVNELRIGLEELEESRDTLNYALDQLENGVGFVSYSNVTKEIELLTEFNNRLAKHILGMVENQEGLNISLESLLTVELGLNKEEELEEIPF